MEPFADRHTPFAPVKWIAPWLLLASAVAGAQPGTHPADGKCGLAARLAELRFTPAVPGKTSLPVVSAPLAYQASRTIGSFRFNYDTTGSNAPALLDVTGARIPGSHEAYVDSAGAIFNEVYAIETGELGYGDPIQPGQDFYDVNIFNNVYYGETVPETQIGFSTPSRWRSHINIENDFQNFYSTGIAGLRVTAAHEFHHAIQFAVYGYWNTDAYFMELTSTWMEDVVYDDVNDYYQYVRAPSGSGGFTQRGVFAQPDVSFFKTDGLIEYSRAVYGKFVEKEFGRDVIRRAWELIPTGVALNALDRALGEVNSSFRSAFSTWVSWNAHTGPAADTVLYYTEGRGYPPVRTRPRIDFLPPSRSIFDSIQTTSAAYYTVGLADTFMSVIILNTSTAATPVRKSFEYQMSETGDGTFRQLENLLFVRLQVPDPVNWETIESVPTEVEPVITTGITPAPNPLRSGDLDFLIPGHTAPSSVRLKVLSAALEEVFDGGLTLRPDLSSSAVQVAQWSGTDRFGRQVGSGVFVYILSVDGVDHTGKIAIVR